MWLDGSLKFVLIQETSHYKYICSLLFIYIYSLLFTMQAILDIIQNPNKHISCCSYAYWPKDGAQRQSFPGLPLVTSRDLVCEVHAWRLNKTWCFPYAFRNITTWRLHFIAAWPKSHWIFFFPFTFNYFKGSSLRTRSFVLKIESSKAVSLIQVNKVLIVATRKKHLWQIFRAISLVIWWYIHI